MDNSQLDNNYFIDQYVYNCPFCKRGNVTYIVENRKIFDWTDEKPCYIYIAACGSCGNRSMHLTFEDINYQGLGYANRNRFAIEEGEDLDSKFFYSVPTSFFALDKRIPKVLRLLFVEAEGCLKSNYLTGASVCVRKIIYELAILENAIGDNYDERIKSLKEIRSDVEPEYFDTLLTIQQLTSDKVHEDSYDGWESSHLKLLLSTLGEILTLMYVIPEMRKEKRIAILNLKQKLTGDDKNV
jgi:hypothetical protein